MLVNTAEARLESVDWVAIFETGAAKEDVLSHICSSGELKFLLC